MWPVSSLPKPRHSEPSCVRRLTTPWRERPDAHDTDTRLNSDEDAARSTESGLSALSSPREPGCAASAERPSWAEVSEEPDAGVDNEDSEDIVLDRFDEVVGLTGDKRESHERFKAAAGRFIRSRVAAGAAKEDAMTEVSTTSKHGKKFKKGGADPPAPPMDPQIYANMQQIFGKYDSDGSNTLSVEELKLVMQEVGMPVDDNFGDVFARYDADQSGKISFTELRSWDDFRRRYSDTGVVPKQMEMPKMGVTEGASTSKVVDALPRPPETPSWGAAADRELRPGLLPRPPEHATLGGEQLGTADDQDDTEADRRELLAQVVASFAGLGITGAPQFLDLEGYSSLQLEALQVGAQRLLQERRAATPGKGRAAP